MDSAIIAASRLRNSIKTYYVRPTGSTYGTGDGLSYANAWSGNADLQTNSATAEAQNLIISETHTESISIPCNLNKLEFDTVTSTGQINATGLTTGLSIVGFNINECLNIKSNNATGQNIYLQNMSTTFKGICNVSNSDNQGVQHWSDTDVIYDCDIIGDDCADEVLSGHLNHIVTIKGNIKAHLINLASAQAIINFIESGNWNITPTATFDIVGNYTYFAYAINADTVESLQLTIDNPNSIGVVRVDGGTLNIQSSEILEAGIVLDTICTINDSIIDKISTPSTFSGTLNINDSTIKDLATSSLSTPNFNFVNSEIAPSSNSLNANFNATRCLFDGALNTNHTFIFTGGTLSLDHNTFINTTNARFMFIIEATVTVNYLNNFTTNVNIGDTGRGIFSRQSITVNNSIFKGAALPLFAFSGATITANNCNFFGSAATSGTIVNNNEVIGDPLFEDEVNLDFRLGVGSPCIGAGVTTAQTTGIDTADWISEPPVITTKEQTAPFDCGAYVN